MHMLSPRQRNMKSTELNNENEQITYIVQEFPWR